MATVLDIGLFQAFDVIYPVLIVFAIVFSILQKTKALGSTSMNAIVAVMAAFTILLSRTLIDIINFMIPWFVVAIIFFVLLLLIFMVFGASEKDIFAYMKSDKAVGWVIVGVAIAIIFAAFGSVLGQTVGPYLEDNATSSEGVATGSFEQNIMATLFHPKILGLAVIMTIAIFAIALLSGT